jgi:hypothetical protein
VRPKLHREVVRAIRTADPSIPTIVLARQHGIPQSTVSNVLRGLCYKEQGYKPMRASKNKLNWVAVREIRRLRAEGVKLLTLAVQYNVSGVAIHQICKGHHWANDPLHGMAVPITAPKSPRAFITKIVPEQVREVRRLHSEGWHADTIAMQMEIGINVVRNIITKRSWAKLA